MKALIFITIFAAFFVISSDARSINSWRIRRDIWDTIKSGAGVVVDGAKDAGRFVADKTKDGYNAAKDFITSKEEEKKVDVVVSGDEERNKHIMVFEQQQQQDVTDSAEPSITTPTPTTTTDDLLPTITLEEPTITIITDDPTKTDTEIPSLIDAIDEGARFGGQILPNTAE